MEDQETLDRQPQVATSAMVRPVLPTVKQGDFVWYDQREAGVACGGRGKGIVKQIMGKYVVIYIVCGYEVTGLVLTFPLSAARPYEDQNPWLQNPDGSRYYRPNASDQRTARNTP